MLKIFVGVMLILMAAAIFYFGKDALIGVIGLAIGVFVGETLDFTVRREAERDEDEDAPVRPRR